MIELEVKYEIAKIPVQINELELISSKTQKDVYYDTCTYDLLKGGNFLRIRNNKKLEFKLDIKDETHLFCKETAFDLKSSENRINDILGTLKCIGIKTNAVSIEGLLKEFSELAIVEKYRKEYRFNNNCVIAVDSVKGLGTFLEAEVIIEEESITIEEANIIKENLINELISAGILNEVDKIVNIGYVELFLIKYNKEAYEKGKFKL